MAYKHRLDLTMGMPKGMNRMDQFPLDMSSVYYDYAAMVTYATTSAIAYVGQPLSLVDEENKTVTLYTIQDTEGNLKKVGTSPVGDESTITVAEDGTVSLYGIEGLALTREVEENGETVTKKINYQPLLVDGKLTWVEPSATTVEGLAAEIEGLKTRISTLENTVDKAIADNEAAITAIDEKIGEVETDKTIVQMIADAQTAATYDDTALAGRVSTIESDYLKSADKTELTEAIATAKQEAIDSILGENIDADFDTLKEVADWIQSDTTNSAALISRVSAIEDDYLKGTDKDELQDQISELDLFVGQLPEDAVSTTLVNYIQEVVDDLKIGDYAKAADLTDLAGRVTTAEGKIAVLEEAGAEKNVINSVDTAQFSIDEERKLSLLDLAISKVTGLQEALDSKVEKVEGSRLITDTEAAKLEALVIAEDGSVEVSGEIHASKVQELDAWITQRADTLEGLSENNLTDELVNKINESQANVIEAISVNGVDQEIVDKKVNIKLASAAAAGVVVSSDAENKVSVSESDGTMEINSINANKIVQTEGEFMILNGGSATLNITNE